MTSRFVVLYAAEHTAIEYVPRELQMFWGENSLVTVHQGELAIVDQARRRWEQRCRPHSFDEAVTLAIAGRSVNPRA